MTPEGSAATAPPVTLPEGYEPPSAALTPSWQPGAWWLLECGHYGQANELCPRQIGCQVCGLPPPGYPVPRRVVSRVY